MKKVWKYVIISILLLLGLGCVGILYLFFVSNATLFKITYINKHTTLETNKFDMHSISTVNLTTRSYDVSILEAEEDTIHVEAYSNSFGFVLEKNKDLHVSTNKNGSVLEIYVQEPHGFAIKNNSKIKLFLPSSKSFNVTINNKSAEVKIDSSNLKINNLNYTTNSGKLTFSNGELIGKLTANIGSGSIDFNETFKTNNNAVDLKITTGRFNALNATLGDILLLENNRGVITINKCNRIEASFDVAGGQIVINECLYASIRSSDTNVNIGVAANGAAITLTGSGNVNIATTTALSTIKTQSGNIKIENALSNLTVETDMGNITIDSAFTMVSARTNYGTVKIHFNDEANHYSESAVIKSRVLYAKIANGKLIATGVEHVGALTEETGISVSQNGRIELRMNNVIGKNDISGANGNVHVVVDKSSEYILKTSTESGSVKVNLAQIPNYGGYTTTTEVETKVNTTASSNSLTVSTLSGNLTVLDSNFA